MACRYLLGQGFDVLARRYRGRSGEVDIIALEGDILAFIEVKTRSTKDFGEPWEFVDWHKQQMVRRTAEEFIGLYDLGQYSYRFDIIAVLVLKKSSVQVTLYRNAF